MRRISSIMLILLAPLATAATASRDEGHHVAVTLVSEQSALVPGQTTWLGIRLQHQPQWHTYWVNPGDSGLPTQLHWTLPPGFKAGEIAWPAPHRFTASNVYNFGYGGDVLLPVQVDVPADAKLGTKAHLVAAAKWLACREQCVPGKATLTLNLAVAAHAAADSRWSKAFAGARAMRPQQAAWQADAHLAGAQVDVVLHGLDLPPADGLDAFSPQMRVLGYAPPQVAQDGDALKLTFAKSEYFAAPPATLDLVVTSGDTSQVHAWSVSLPFAAAPDTASKP
jgi:thiol:disulfide interchange protein DsbD